MFDFEYLISVVISVALVMVSASFHEAAHGYVAYLLGDPTAKEAGRLTLNPLAHIHSFGSLALPLIMAILGGPIFAFAKPVPYNPRRLRHPRRDELLVALAGPASNILQALFGTALLWFVIHAFFAVYSTNALIFEIADWSFYILSTYIYLNLILCFFNLIIFPPLDGSKIVLFFLKGNARLMYYKLQNYSMFVLILVLYFLPSVLHIDPLGAYFNMTAYPLYYLLVGCVI